MKICFKFSRRYTSNNSEHQSDGASWATAFIDLCGPSAIESIGGNKYILVIVDDFSWFNWVYFLKQKLEATPQLKEFIKQIELQLRKLVCNIRSDSGWEFKN